MSARFQLKRKATRTVRARRFCESGFGHKADLTSLYLLVLTLVRNYEQRKTIIFILPKPRFLAFIEPKTRHRRDAQFVLAHVGGKLTIDLIADDFSPARFARSGLVATHRNVQNRVIFAPQSFRTV